MGKTLMLPASSSSVNIDLHARLRKPMSKVTARRPRYGALRLDVIMEVSDNFSGSSLQFAYFETGKH
jgi:hypothetical protein